ncbi:MAG: putative ATPase, partial [Mycobacterium sp.]|nr:putative ATPase [Mycobacterium sp.]
GAVVTHETYGTSEEGFDAEWRMVAVMTVDGDLFTRYELFDEDDIDAALTRFDELSRPATQLENAASRAFKRFQTYFAAREWTAMAEILAEDMCNDDRRRVVGAGVLHGRDTDVAHMRAIADVGAKTITSTVVATRGERLVLRRVLFSGEDQGSEAFEAELLGIVEIDADERIVARLSFEPDDRAAAFEELDTRYLAGEAAAHAHTWSVIAATYAAFNRHGLVPDWVSVDHRRGSPFASNDLNATIRASRDLTPDLSIHIETVHRLSAFGAVVTNMSFGTSDEGFAAEWRMVQLLTVDGDRITRLEIFDEDDIDAALAGFDDLNRPAPQLENVASQMDDRFWTYFAARDWTAMAEILAEDMCNDDRRRVVGAGVLRGRDTDIAHMRAIADVGAKTMASTFIATRGERLALRRFLFSGEDQGPEAFQAELLGIAEIDADERIVARVSFDADDVDAAFEELDTRYLAGEAAAHSYTWSVIARAYAALNRHEVPATTSDCVNVDHRRGIPFAPDDMTEIISSAWEFAPDICYRIEAVHRLSNLGAVVTHAANGTSREGFDAEWRGNVLLTVEGDLINRCEIFDEADLDAALARFDELNHPSPQLENAATRTWKQIVDACNRRDADGFLALTSADGELEDRRKGLHVSLEGSARRKAAQSLCRAPKNWRMEVEPIAVRGDRLGLTRERWRDTAEADRPITVEALTLTEVTGDELVHHTEVFDPDDIDQAFTALDARYVAGEAAAHSDTWSVIAGACAAFNRRESPPTAPDWTNIDHRRAIAVTPGDMTAYINATLELTPDVNLYIEAVHRLSNLGAVVTHVSKGTSQQGFDAEWRLLNLMTVEGDLINRCELFDEEDLDAALARFDELNRPAPKLENAAIRARARVADTYNRRDLEGFLALAGGRYEDRRKGLRDEGAADRNFAQAVLSETPASWRLEIEPVAIRGDRLALSRETFRDADEVNQPITVELIVLTEVADAELDSYTVFFDPDDINSAIAELTARWIASGEVAHPDVIESVQQINEIVSRHDWDAIAKHFAGASYVNHRQLAQAGTGTIADWLSSMRTIESLVPDFWVELAEVLTRSAIGIVGRMTLKGTSTEGSAIEIPYVLLILFDGGRVTRFEAFDEDQRDLAMARFDEVSRPA